MSGRSLPLDLAVDVDEIRASPKAMRATLLRLCEQGTTLWAGSLPDLLHTLVEVARVDLCLARLVEGHADALRILDQAGRPPEPGVYGVWASRSVGTGVKAAGAGDRWHLHGELRFASGIGLIDRALLPVWPEPETHLLVDMPVAAVHPRLDSWPVPAMDASRSFTVDVDTVVPREAQVGPADFYLSRPGFVVGGLGPAAVWLGGAQQVLDLVAAGLRSFAATPHQLRRVGAMEQAVWQARVALATVGSAVGGLASRGGEKHAAREVARARTAVVLACETVLEEAGRVVGPAGLSASPRLARALADLAVYVRQHHLDTELTRAGEDAVDERRVLGE